MLTHDPIALFIQFFQRSLPAYSPQAENMFRQAARSAIGNQQFRYIFSVEAMTDLSHLIEDAAVQTARKVNLHVSFQYLSRLSDQLERYKKIAEEVDGLWLYAAPDAPFPPFPNTTLIDTSQSPLINYWFVIAYGSGLSMTLLAEEKPAPTNGKGEYRIYEGFYTFDEEVAYKILNLLHLIYPEQVPPPLPAELL